MSDDGLYDDNLDDDDLFSLSMETVEDLRKGKIDSNWSEEELLIIRYIDGLKMREMGNASTGDIEKLLGWYNKIIVANELINLVLEGDVYITFTEEDANGDNPVFFTSLQGKKKLKKDLLAELENEDE